MLIQTLPVFLFVALGSVAAFAAEPNATTNSELWLFVGTYTTPDNPGIHAFRFNTDTGQLRSGHVAAQAENPSFLAIHPNGRFLYAVDETPRFDNQTGGGVTAFEIDATSGTLRRLNARGSRGEHPCHLSIDNSAHHVLVANYTGGSVSVLPILEDGRLGESTDLDMHSGSGPNAQRQEKPHAHGIYPAPTGPFVLVPDLGTDRIVAYRLDSTAGSLTALDTAGARVRPGSGPRHLAFDPSGNFVYVVHELVSTVTVHRWDPATGTLAPIQEISTRPPEATRPNTTAEIEVHPSGQFVYASNRGDDTIAVFRVDASSGRLTAAGHQPAGGRTPRNFVIDPSGRWLLVAHQDSNSVQPFRIDPTSGQLTATHEPTAVPKPVCLRFLAPK